MFIHCQIKKMSKHIKADIENSSGEESYYKENSDKENSDNE